MYSIEVRPKADKDIDNLPLGYASLVSNHIDGLVENPRPHGAKKLHGSNEYSLRVGVYRVIYTIDDEARAIIIFRVKHRREAY